MRTAEEISREVFRCRDGRNLEMLHDPCPRRAHYWLPFENEREISNLLALLESKKWWGGYAHSLGFLWHVNRLREAEGLPPLALLPCRALGTRIVEISQSEPTGIGQSSPPFGRLRRILGNQHSPKKGNEI